MCVCVCVCDCLCALLCTLQEALLRSRCVVLCMPACARVCSPISFAPSEAGVCVLLRVHVCLCAYVSFREKMFYWVGDVL
jgi:hypothetical protein